MEIDQKVIDLLKQTDFERQNLQGATLYVNQAQSSIQKLVFAFHVDYKDAETARTNEALMDLYLHSLQKGTVKHPSADALTRAFRGQRVHEPVLYSQRKDSKLNVLMSMDFPAGEQAKELIPNVLQLLQYMMREPKVLQDEETFQKAKQEVARSYQAKISDHGHRASQLFQNKYFFPSEPILDEGIIGLIGETTLKETRRTFEKHMSKAYSIIFFSGDMNFGVLERIIAPFVTAVAGTPKNRSLNPPLQQRLGRGGKRDHVEGSSQQMQFMRAYPLVDLPELEDQVTLDLVNRILGGGWTSHLLQAIREQHHLVYGIHSQLLPFKNMVLISTEHDPNHYSRMEELTGEIVRNLVKGNFTQKEFEEAKNSAMERCLLSVQGGIASCEHPQFRIIEGASRLLTKTETFTPEEKYRKLSEIKPGDVKRVMKKYLNPNRSQVFTYCQEEGQ